MLTIKESKVKAVEEIRDKFNRASSAILTDYRGLNVAEITELRRKLWEEDVEYKVLKNTLINIAVKELGYDLDEYLSGPTAIAFSYGDAVAPAKALAEFAKKNKSLELKAGVVEGKVGGKDMVIELSQTPPREELLAKAVGSIQSPLYDIVGTLEGNLRNLVYCLQAVQDTKVS